MKRILTICCFALVMGSCVTKAKYESVVTAIHSKEKQQKKLEKQIQEMKELNQKLRDSADRIGG